MADNWIDITFENGYAATIFVPIGHYSTIHELLSAIQYGKNLLVTSLEKTLEQYDY